MKSGEIEGTGAGYDAAGVEEKWQREWRSAAAFDAPPRDDRHSTYVLASYPLPTEGADLGQIRSYTIADAFARFRRASGEAVLFSVGMANGDGLQARLERLGCSCDWSRVADASQPSQYRWTQWLFLELLERDLVYEKARQWFLRSTGYLGANEEGLESLGEWNEAAAETQRAAVGKVEGFEVDATVLGVGQFPAFTPHGEDVEGAAFVALSPLFPDVEVFAQEPEVAAKLKQLREQPAGADATPVQTGLQASVPGVADLLPVIVWPAVESRYGPTAVLGLPERDEEDARVAAGLEQASSLGGIKLSAKSGGKPKPATRYKAEDTLISQPWAEGRVVLPIVHCEKCGSVPVPREQLPVELGSDQGIECECPGCGGPAQRAAETIDPRLDWMWMWMSICVPADDRQSEMFGHEECQRWLPAAQVVAGPGAGELLFDQRLAAKVLQDIEAIPQEAREPFQRAFVHETVRVEGGEGADGAEGIDDPDQLVERIGADAVRFALLSAAAPTTAFRWTQTPVRHGQRFVAELWEYAEPRLREWSGSEAGEIDTSTPLRRRLATWVRIGADKVTTNLEQLDMQRATRNMRLLLTRIRDFEQRATAAGELDDADRAAIVDSLLVLLRLLAPCAPHVCEELWELSGQESLLAAAPWPAGSETSSNDANPRVRSSTG